MTGPILVLVVCQAALLLWASIRLGDVFLRHDKAAQFAWFVGIFALPAAIAWWGRINDPHRILCGLGDCVALALSVAFVRFWAVSKEEEQFLLERQVARQAAADRAEAARKVMEADRVIAATAALEARKDLEAPFQTQPVARPVPPGGTRPPSAPPRP